MVVAHLDGDRQGHTQAFGCLTQLAHTYSRAHRSDNNSNTKESAGELWCTTLPLISQCRFKNVKCVALPKKQHTCCRPSMCLVPDTGVVSTGMVQHHLF
jgi:hypothetical protein